VWSQSGTRRSSISQPDSASLPLGLPDVRPAFRRLTALAFPRRFPIVQFPNLPLIVAFLASQSGRVVGAGERPYTTSISYLAMTIWAYEELVDGVNWFRHLLGFTYLVIIVVRVAQVVAHG
jgi:hypothetical protein